MGRFDSKEEREEYDKIEEIKRLERDNFKVEYNSDELTRLVTTVPKYISDLYKKVCKRHYLTLAELQIYLLLDYLNKVEGIKSFEEIKVLIKKEADRRKAYSRKKLLRTYLHEYTNTVTSVLYYSNKTLFIEGNIDIEGCYLIIDTAIDMLRTSPDGMGSIVDEKIEKLEKLRTVSAIEELRRKSFQDTRGSALNNNKIRRR